MRFDNVDDTEVSDDEDVGVEDDELEDEQPEIPPEAELLEPDPDVEEFEPEVDETPADAAATLRAPTRFARLGDLVLEFGPWKNPRKHTGLGDDDIAQLAASIKKRTTQDADTGDIYAGIEDALRVVQCLLNGDVVHLILDGQRRYLAARKASLPDDALIPVVDREPEPVVLTPALASRYLMEVLESVGTRAGLSSFELADSARRLRNSKDPDTGTDYTLAAVGAAIGKSDSWVSKILKAMDNAKPTLAAKWRKGEITDEQFKALAAEKDEEEQDKAAEAVAEARKSGSAATARTLAKEAVEKVRAAKPEKPAKPAKAAKIETRKDGNKVTIVRGPQAELPIAAPAKPAGPKKPSMAVIDDILHTAGKTPPTHDYVKGLVAGVRYSAGLLDPDKFAPPWHTYMAHVQGNRATLKKSPKAKAKR